MIFPSSKNRLAPRDYCSNSVFICGVRRRHFSIYAAFSFYCKRWSRSPCPDTGWLCGRISCEWTPWNQFLQHHSKDLGNPAILNPNVRILSKPCCMRCNQSLSDERVEAWVSFHCTRQGGTYCYIKLLQVEINGSHFFSSNAFSCAFRIEVPAILFVWRHLVHYGVS